MGMHASSGLEAADRVSQCVGSDLLRARQHGQGEYCYRANKTENTDQTPEPAMHEQFHASVEKLHYLGARRLHALHQEQGHADDDQQSRCQKARDHLSPHHELNLVRLHPEPLSAAHQGATLLDYAYGPPTLLSRRVPRPKLTIPCFGQGLIGFAIELNETARCYECRQIGRPAHDV